MAAVRLFFLVALIVCAFLLAVAIDGHRRAVKEAADPHTTTVTRYNADGIVQQWKNTTYPKRDRNRIWFYTEDGRLVEVYGDVAVEY